MTHSIQLTSTDPTSNSPGGQARELAPLFELLLLLGTLLGALVLHASRAEPLTFAGVTLTQPDIGDWYVAAPRLGPEPPRAVATLGTSIAATTAPLKSRSSKRTELSEGDSEAHTPLRVLMLGDSMIEALQGRAAAYFAKSDDKFLSVIWYGSRTLDWGRDQRLQQVLGTYAPDYVIIVLGSNELTARNVEKRITSVRAMFRTLGEIPAIWIGPPNWRKDTGINQMLADELGQAFFSSEHLQFERKNDGIHPTEKSGSKWMDHIAAWLASRPENLRLHLTAPEPGKVKFHAPAKVWPPPSR